MQKLLTKGSYSAADEPADDDDEGEEEDGKPDVKKEGKEVHLSSINQK